MVSDLALELMGRNLSPSTISELDHRPCGLWGYNLPVVSGRSLTPRTAQIC